MSRRLTLLRHAKSSWKDATLPDFERPLNKRGEHDAPMMGRRLLARGERPSLILVSPARRARRTAQLLAREMGYPMEFLQHEEELYLASPAQIIAVVARQDSAFRQIMVCAHNPGLTDLANQLGDAGIENIPTCGLVGLDLNIRGWAELAPGRATLAYFDYPRKPPVD